MESTASKAKDATAGNKRADRVRTRGYARAMQQQEKERECRKQGLSEEDYWTRYVRSEADIVTFYQLYHPEYPELLAKAIAIRVARIIEKSHTQEPLTEEECAYVQRSKAPPKHWDFEEELKQQELAGKVQLAMKKLE